jgi:hypothetical protein
LLHYPGILNKHIERKEKWQYSQLQNKLKTLEKFFLIPKRGKEIKVNNKISFDTSVLKKNEEEKIKDRDFYDKIQSSNPELSDEACD